jgi:hypothetical protein
MLLSPERRPHQPPDPVASYRRQGPGGHGKAHANGRFLRGLVQEVKPEQFSVNPTACAEDTFK